MIGFLTYQGTSKVPKHTKWDSWPECAIVKDLFGPMVNELPVGAVAPFKSVEGDKDDVYQTLFKDDCEGEGLLIS